MSVKTLDNVQLSVSKDIQNFKTIALSFETILEVTCIKNYSAIRFANNIRNSANFLSADLCILDFDGNLSLETAKILFADYQAIIVTTKSHQKSSKNGVGIEKRDRFRVLIPLDKRITSINEFERVMKNVTRDFNSDDACVDGARFFYPNPYQTQWISSGNKLIDTTFYAVLPTKGDVRLRKTNFKRTDITLEGDIDITNKEGLTLTASEWAQELDADTTVTVHCPNPEHPDLHPSAFIAHATSDESKIFIFCHVCGTLGTYPKSKNNFRILKKELSNVNKTNEIYH